MTEETADQRMRRLVTGSNERPLPRRFYKVVGVSDGNGILLDGKQVKTPLKAALALPTRALAEAVAAEWDAQAKSIDPALMPLTKLANTAIDRAAAERKNVIAEIMNYAGADLVCYRAETPQDLRDLQDLNWNPVLEFAQMSFGASFTKVNGIVHVAQPETTLAKTRAQLEALDPYRLTILFNLTTLTGSALLSLMLVQGKATAEQGWLAAHVDEDFQARQWGADDEAQARRAARRAEYDGLLRFLDFLARFPA